uniref:hypothetical protein n=1 Tax=Spiroplasma citri TaxID=2133 RepID=UPI0018E26462|nr:hypothetical protein [Spiroplasma citri]
MKNIEIKKFQRWHAKKMVESEKEAKQKEWKYITLMNNILRERYEKQNNNNEND